MKPVDAVIIGSVTALFLAGLVFQRCDYAKRLLQQQAQTTKADTQLVATTRELATEHNEQARAEAVETVHAAEEQALEEVQHAEGDADLVDYLRAAIHEHRAGD